MGSMGQFMPAPPAAITRVLSTFDRRQLEGFIAVAIDLLDLAAGDPNLEDNGDLEQTGDEADVAWPEWRGRGEQRPVGTLHRNGDTPYLPHEDDEDDDPMDSTEAEDDGLPRFKLMGSGPGCTVSDPDLEHDGAEQEEPLHPSYGLDQTNAIGHSEAEQLARWDSLPEAPRLVPAKSPLVPLHP